MFLMHFHSHCTDHHCRWLILLHPWQKSFLYHSVLPHRSPLGCYFPPTKGGRRNLAFIKDSSWEIENSKLGDNIIWAIFCLGCMFTLFVYLLQDKSFTSISCFWHDCPSLHVALSAPIRLHSASSLKKEAVLRLLVVDLSCFYDIRKSRFKKEWGQQS